MQLFPLFDSKPSQVLRVHLRTTRLRMLHEGCRMLPSTGPAPCWEVSVTPVTPRGWICHAALTEGFLQRLSWGRRQRVRMGMAQGEEVCPKIRLEKVATTNSSSQQGCSIIHLMDKKKILTPKGVLLKSSSLLHIQHCPTETSPSFQKTSGGCFAVFHVFGGFFFPFLI